MEIRLFNPFLNMEDNQKNLQDMNAQELIRKKELQTMNMISELLKGLFQLIYLMNHLQFLKINLKFKKKLLIKMMKVKD